MIWRWGGPLATDNSGNATARLPVFKNTTVPTLTASSGPAPLTVIFDARHLAIPMTCTINFGDGTTGALTKGSCSDGEGGIRCSGSAYHTYAMAGTKMAMLSDACGSAAGIVMIKVDDASASHR